MEAPDTFDIDPDNGPMCVGNSFIMFSIHLKRNFSDMLQEGIKDMIADGTADPLSARSKFMAKAWRELGPESKQKWKDLYKAEAAAGRIVSARHSAGGGDDASKKKASPRKSKSPPKKKRGNMSKAAAALLGAAAPPSKAEPAPKRRRTTTATVKPSTTASTALMNVLKANGQVSRTAASRLKARTPKLVAKPTKKKYGPRGDPESTHEFHTTHNLCDGFTSDEDDE